MGEVIELRPRAPSEADGCWRMTIDANRSAKYPAHISLTITRDSTGEVQEYFLSPRGASRLVLRMSRVLDVLRREGHRG